ncbi:MAG TPA: cyclic nucleotide-binding domain-containing protein [Terriglobales bacterium]|nr:cyclic nucleotide-binding domain-containing protein [Terriglobales bacterium]
MPGHLPQSDNPGEKSRASLLDRFASGQQRRFAPRSALFSEGDAAESLHMLREGQVEIRISAGNQTLFRRVAYPGFLLGVAAAISDRSHNYTAVAVEAVITSSLSRSEFRNYLKENPEACFEVVQAIGTELMEIFEGGLRPIRNKPRHLKPHV